MKLLINLPPGFFNHPSLQSIFQKIETLGEIKRLSANTPAEIQESLSWADAVLMWSWPVLTDDLLAKAPNLKFSANLDISQKGAGVLLKRGIPVSLAKRAFSPAVAEMALTLTLATLRRTSTFHAQMWKGEEPWVGAFPDDIDPYERQLTGRKVGLVGLGGIGQRIVELLAPFHCHVSAYDPFLPPEIAQKLGVELTDLDPLAAQSEIVIVCAAANPGSAHLIQKKHIQSLKPGAVFVNVSRASLIDYAALLERLKKGDLFASLDVFEKEPLEKDSEFRKLPNVYLTPHRAGGIMESVERILLHLYEDLQAHAAGQPRKHGLTEKMISSLDA